MSKLLKSQAEIRIEHYSEVPKEVIEKRFIMDFLNQVPLDDLKSIVNFKEYDPTNKNHWGNSRESKEIYDLLSELRFKNCIKLECEIQMKTKIV